MYSAHFSALTKKFNHIVKPFGKNLVFLSMTKDISTEKKILEAARAVFVQQGMKGTRMQEIADRAGINKALLHYYFRSKEALFERVFSEALQSHLPVMLGVLSGPQPLKAKIEGFVELYMEFLKQNPFMPLFIISEISQSPEKVQGLISSKVAPIAAGLAAQLHREAESGVIRPIEPVDFITAVMGLCVFPIIAKPIVMPVFGLDEQAYQEFLERRKSDVPAIIWNYLTDKSKHQ